MLCFGSEASSELSDCEDLTQMSSFWLSSSALPNRPANIWLQQILKEGQWIPKGPWWLFEG